MFCEKCGAQLNNSERFCYRCGAKISAQAENIQAVRKPKRIGPIILGASLLIFVLAGVILLFLVFGNKGKRYEDQIALAERYINELDYDKAIAAYQEAIGIDSERPEAYIGLAKVYEETEDHEAAIDILEKGYKKTRDRTVKRKLDKARNTIAKADAEKEVTPTVSPTPTFVPTSTPTPTEPGEEPCEEEPTVGDSSQEDLVQASAMLDATAKKKYREAIERELEGVQTDVYSFAFIYLDGDDIPEIAMFCEWWSSVFWYDGDVVEIAGGTPVTSIYYSPYTGKLLYDNSAEGTKVRSIIVNKDGKDTLPTLSRYDSVVKGDMVFEAIEDGNEFKVNGKKVPYDECTRQIGMEKQNMIYLRADYDEAFAGRTIPKEEFMKYLE